MHQRDPMEGIPAFERSDGSVHHKTSFVFILFQGS
jgi:hypothetical protein